MRKWRNWQTRTFEGRVVHTVRVQVPSSAPTIKGWILSIPLLFVQKYRAEPAPIRQNWIALRKIDFAQNEPRRKAWFASPVFRTEKYCRKGYVFCSIFLSKPQAWYGINAPARCMELRRSRAWHRTKRVSKLFPMRIDSIHHFVMIPYGTSCQFHTATSCGFHARLTP